MYSTRTDGYFVGFAELTVGEVVEHYPEFFFGFSILFTCLDSTPELRTFGQSLQSKSTKLGIRVIDESIWIDITHVKDFLAAPYTLLTHFDELYLLKGPQPAGVSIHQTFTTDRTRFSEAVPTSFLQAFQLFHATRYLSDGCGLNFACEDSAIVPRIAQLESKLA